MPDSIVYVAFTVNDPAKFETSLQSFSEHDDNIVGLRTGESLELRSPLRSFADQMELKLRKNDHKRGWRELSIKALFRMLLVEIEEYKVAHKYLTVKEARQELIDVANYCLIVWDRLSLEKQGEPVVKPVPGPPQGS